MDQHSNSYPRVDDVVECLVDEYVGVKKGQRRKVKKVIPGKNTLIQLKNKESDYGTSDYKASNFKLIYRPTRQEDSMPAPQKTKYFALRLDSEGLSTAFLDFKDANDDQTTLRNSKSEVLEDIKSMIEAGQKWIILQTHAVVELPKPTTPPVRITEYK